MELLKTVFSDLRTIAKETSAEVLNSTFEKHLNVLGFTDANHQWIPEIAHRKDDILFDFNDRKATFFFIDRVEQNLMENNFIMGFIPTINRDDYPKMIANYERDKQEALVHVLTYAILLDRTTRLLIDNWQELEVFRQAWKKSERFSPNNMQLGLFEKVKYFSVEYPVKKFIEANQKGLTPENMLRTTVKINIFEAVVQDALSGNFSNAVLGFNLIRKMNHQSTQITDGRLKYNLENGNVWVDGYQCWNMNFCTQWEDWPFHFCKLMIPSVADYQNDPENYIHSRMVSLFIHLNYSFSKNFSGSYSMDWPVLDLRKAWGIFNRTCAPKLEEKKEEVDSPPLSKAS